MGLCLPLMSIPVYTQIMSVSSCAIEAEGCTVVYSLLLSPLYVRLAWWRRLRLYLYEAESLQVLDVLTDEALPQLNVPTLLLARLSLRRCWRRGAHNFRRVEADRPLAQVGVVWPPTLDARPRTVAGPLTTPNTTPGLHLYCIYWNITHS